MDDDAGGGGSKAVSDVEARDWSEMTRECLINVFSRLTLKDRWAGAMATCRAWRDVVTDPALFAVFDLDPDLEPAGPVGKAAWWAPAFDARVDGMIRAAVQWAAGSFVEVRVRHCSDRAVEFLAERCPNLQVLSVKNSQHVTDASMFKIALGCPMLKELDISNCYGITYNSLEVIGKHCPNLSVLKRNLMNWLDPSQHAGIVPNEYRDAFPHDGDGEAEAIARFMPKLKHLELRFTQLSVVGLISLSTGCRQLELLDVFGCANLTSRAVDQASANFLYLKTLVRPNFYIPRSVFHTERYGHWRLYDERFQPNVFQI